MRNSKRFIEKWEKNRLRGRVKYIASLVIPALVIFVALDIISHVTRGGGFMGTFGFTWYIYVAIVTFGERYLRWDINEQKYIKLKGNK